MKQMLESDRYSPLDTRALLRTVAPWLIFAGFLYVISLYSFLLFHSLAELFSICVGVAVFMLAWNTRRFMTNDFLFFIGVSFLFVGVLDLFHTFAYKGMGIFPTDDPNYATQLWIAARYMQSISFFIAVSLMGRKINQRLLLVLFSVVTLLVLATIAAGVFPDCYINGLTPFKKISEYIISLIFALSILRLRRGSELVSPKITGLITYSLLFTILSELIFTFYINVYGPFNFWGHIFKILAVYGIYRAVIDTGLHQPFELLFHEMKKREAELESSQRLLQEIATRDPLTGLPNRLLFEARLTHAIEKTQRKNYTGQQSLVQVIIMDMDDFKSINDMVGHLGGDEVLREIGRRLRAELRESDTVARWGGDEFTCVLEDVPGIEVARQTAQKILSSVTVPMRVEGHDLTISISLGFSLFPLHAQVNEDLLRHADLALYHAKAKKNSFRMYDEIMKADKKSMLNEASEHGL